MDDNKLTLVSDDGTEVMCNILFTHEKEGTHYVVFEMIESGEVTGAIYEPDEDESQGTFKDIETEEEWEMLETLLDSYYKDLEVEDQA